MRSDRYDVGWLLLVHFGGDFQEALSRIGLAAIPKKAWAMHALLNRQGGWYLAQREHLRGLEVDPAHLRRYAEVKALAEVALGGPS